jgi:hypothetical protein
MKKRDNTQRILKTTSLTNLLKKPRKNKGISFSQSALVSFSIISKLNINKP